MGQYLIDNNVISDYFTESFSEKAMCFISGVIDQIPNILNIQHLQILNPIDI